MNKLIWTGAVLDPSGYGEASRGYLKGLGGVDDLEVRVKPKYFWNGSSIGTSDIWPLLQKFHQTDFDRDDAHIFAQHLTPDQWQIGYGRKAYHVGITTFETDSLPYHWLMPMRAMDELWTFSEWGREVFQQQGLTNVRVMPHGVDCQRFRPGIEPLNCLKRSGDPTEYRPIGRHTYVFGSNFDWTERKNPTALLKAYFTAFRPDEDVVLVLKVYHQYPIERSKAYIRGCIEKVKYDLSLNETPDVMIISDIMPSELLPRFYSGLDCYVLPSRGEGWGLTYSEAMATGLPTIGTGWSGNTEFMHPDNSVLLVDYKLVDITPEAAGNQRHYAGHKWADVNVDELSFAMKDCFNRREQYQALGQAAREDMVKHYSWQAIGKRMGARIKEIR